MRGTSAILLVLFAFALACEEEEPPPPPPPPPPFDAGPPMDAGPRPEAGPRPDAGGPGPVVDGVIDEDEWAGAESAEALVDTDSPGSELTRLVALIAGGRLHVGIEGTLADGDVMVLYVDHTLGDGVGVGDLATLTDVDPALDDAISGALVTPSDFAADAAWGTVAMSRAPVGLDEDIGWRLIAGGVDHTWIANEDAPSACSDVACEASIPLETLGGEAPRTIALFARIVTAGGWTNQTLPADDPSAPDVVNALMLIDDGAMEMDAGPPDAGIDAGPMGIVVDGVIDPTEWASAAMATNMHTATGAFTGSDLAALYTLRDATTLYVAIEGTITSGNAIVMYVDTDEGGPLGIASPTTLDDFVGQLDTAISKTMITPSELRLDAAWGTLDMSRVGTASDDRMGWRDIRSNPSAYMPVAGASACGTSGCETSVALSALGVAAAADVGLYVRLVSATSAAFSNQTLPEDDPFSPELVTVYALVPPP